MGERKGRTDPAFFFLQSGRGVMRKQYSHRHRPKLHAVRSVAVDAGADEHAQISWKILRLGGVDGKRNYENLYLQKQNSLRKGLS